MRRRDRESTKKSFFAAAKSQGLIGVGLIVGAIHFEQSILLILGILQLMPVLNLLMAWLAFPKNLSPKEDRERGIDVTLFQ